jgi:hypothetical protein
MVFPITGETRLVFFFLGVSFSARASSVRVETRFSETQDRKEQTMTEQKAKPDPAGCCGEMPIQTEQGCPCTAMMKKHPWAAGAICGTVGLLMLAVPVGAVLGIIAFVRTL